MLVVGRARNALAAKMSAELGKSFSFGLVIAVGSSLAPCRREESPPHLRVGKPGVALNRKWTQLPSGAVDGQEGDVVEGGVLDDEGGVAVERALQPHL